MIQSLSAIGEDAPALRQAVASLIAGHEQMRREHERQVAELQKQCDQAVRQRDEQVAELQKQQDQQLADLQKQRDQQLAELHQRQADLELANLRLQQELNRLKRYHYGPRADKVELGQLLLDFAVALEARPVNEQDLPPQTPESDKPSVRRVRRGRRNLAMLDKRPMIRKIHELSEPERTGPDGRVLQKIGQVITWQIEYIPGGFFRVQHVQIKYASPESEAAGENPRITLAPKPLQPIEKGLAGPGLLAYIITSKFADHLPLYRLQNIFERNGFEIARSTMSVWAGDAADLVRPLYELMKKRVLASHVIGTDDTVLPMQHPGRAKKARIWIYRGDDDHPYNIFDFTIGRGRDGPELFLGDYCGVLLADAYGGYDGICLGNSALKAGCWSHGRRKFTDAQTLAPVIAAEALALIGRLFAVERRAKALKLSHEQRLALRQEQSRPVIEALAAKLPVWRDQLLPKNPMRQAIEYLLNQWEPLTVFLRDGAVALDNNLSEQQMKRIALGRKNYLFVGNERGGRTAAILSSLASTCQRHDIDPQRYLTQLLTALPSLPLSELPQWLPDAWKQREADILPG